MIFAAPFLVRTTLRSVRQFDARPARRLLALFCVCLVSLLLVAEAVHAHPADAGKLRAPGQHCAVCVAAHGTEPAAVLSLPVDAAPAQLLAAAGAVVRPSHDRIIQLFIRPPPAV